MEPTWDDTTPIKTTAPMVKAEPSDIPTWEDTTDVESVGEQAKAAAEAIGRGVSLGGTDIALTQLGLVKPEALSRRMETFPVTSTIGNIAGGAGLMLGTGGLGALAPAGAGLATKAAILAGEGALFGAGSAATDYALGDPELNAQKVITHIAEGAGIGLGLGALGKGIEMALPAASRKIGKVAEAIKGKMAPSELPTMPAEVVAPIIEPVPTKGVKETSLEEMQARNQQAKYQGITIEKPEKAIAEDALSRVEMNNPFHPAELDALSSQDKYNEWQVAREMPGKPGEIIRNSDMIKKKELVDKTAAKINSIAPEHAPIEDAVQGGKHAIEAFTENYEGIRDRLGPLFEQFKKTPLFSTGEKLPEIPQFKPTQLEGIEFPFGANALEGATTLETAALKGAKTKGPTQNLDYVSSKNLEYALEHDGINPDTGYEVDIDEAKRVLARRAEKGGEALIKDYQKGLKAAAPEEFQFQPIHETDILGNVLGKMTKEVPGVARMFDTAAEGIKIKPYTTAWGIEEKTYNAVKQAVKALEEKNLDFESIQNIRNGLKQHVDVMAVDKSAEQIRSLQKAMMDFMQEAIEKAVPDIKVRDVFREYAINEQERSVIEKAFGASVGKPEFGAISKIKPEDINDRIFKNTATVEAAKKILEPKKFNEILANWLAENKAAVTDKGVFSANKWNTFLRKNQDALNIAFADQPGKLQALKDYTTLMRIFPDATSVNPSGTAKTLWQMLKTEAHGSFDLVKILGKFASEKTVGKIQENIQMQNINNMLAGKAERATVLGEVAKMVEKTNDKISKGIGQIFQNKAAKGAIVGGTIKLMHSDYNKNAKKVSEYANNQQKLIDDLNTHTESLYANAPNITQGVINTMMSSMNFLNSKLPKPNNELPLSAKWEPTNSQKASFNRYFNAVSNPVSVLDDIKTGTLSNETMEALQTVHPHLLQDMQMKVMEKMVPGKYENMGYATKISLSKFLQQPLEESMIPQVLASNQVALQSPVNQPGQQMVGKPTLGGMKEMNMSGRAKTATFRDGSEA